MYVLLDVWKGGMLIRPCKIVKRRSRGLREIYVADRPEGILAVVNGSSPPGKMQAKGCAGWKSLKGT